MSAWTVSKRHIDALVYWLDRYALIKDRQKVGEMLWSENYKSIRARYGDYDRDGMFVKRPKYDYRDPLPIPQRGNYDDFDPKNLDQILALVHCYDYQSCEHDGWEKSRSYRLMEKLRVQLELSGAEWKREGTRPPWGI
jgi:hypothetical protein